jgi:hypothetical protein
VNTTTTDQGFAGWVRTPGRPWRRLCDAETHDDALAELLRRAAGEPGAHKDLVVRPSGQHPAAPVPTVGP